MPLYEYTCRSCESDFEMLVSSLEEKVNCPQCDGEEVNRHISLPATPQVKTATGCSTQGPPCSPRCCRL